MDNYKSCFIYDTHVHTAQASKCSPSRGKDIALSYRKAGYDGIIITDHFLNGYTAVPAGLSWDESMDHFCSGFDEAYEQGCKIGLVVLFGWEYNFNGSEFLTYGLNKEWLKSHPDMLSWSPETYFAAVHRDGGFISQAHPFRLREDIPPVQLFPDLIDAIEVFNGGNQQQSFNGNALAYAQEHGLFHTAGSDTHSAENIKPGAMAFPQQIQSVSNFIEAIRNCEYKILDEKPIRNLE